MTQDEQICSLALTRIPGLGLTGAFRLVSSLGSATRVFEHRKELSQLVPGVSEKIITHYFKIFSSSVYFSFR